MLKLYKSKIVLQAVQQCKGYDGIGDVHCAGMGWWAVWSAALRTSAIPRQGTCR